MRKLISIFLIAVYCNAAMALGIDIHFCGKKITDIRLMGFGHPCSGCEKHHVPGGCCKEYMRFCHTDQHRNTSPIILNNQVLVNNIVPPVEEANLINASAFCEPGPGHQTLANPPKDIIPDSCPLYIQNEVFRI